jgi:hypothetical protein
MKSDGSMTEIPASKKTVILEVGPKATMVKTSKSERI